MSGEWTGKSGTPLRWVVQPEGERVEALWCGEWVGTTITAENLDLAIAARDAWRKEREEAEQWVEIGSPGAVSYRISSDGSRLQVMKGVWKDERWPLGMEFYRKGREVALAETAALREQVKELVEAIGKLENDEDMYAGPDCGCRSCESFRPVVNLAKKVRL